jgi:hypothetical protein
MKILNGNLSQHFRAVENGFVNVYRNGLLYCEKPFLKNTLFYINLPFNGFYSFSGFGFVLMETTSLIYSDIKINLPEPERNAQSFGISKVSIDNLSTSPARIAVDKNLVILNPKFFKYPVEIRFFILLHELGHYFYKTEWKCDQYAAHHFLKMGLNPSQAFASLAGVLHETKADGTINQVNKDRNERIYNLLATK